MKDMKKRPYGITKFDGINGIFLEGEGNGTDP
jgi:hypothetical protein